MRRLVVVLVVTTLCAGSLGVLGVEWGIALAAAVMIGEIAGGVVMFLAIRRARQQARRIRRTLLDRLIQMGDTLQEVSLDSLQQRGGWDRVLFDDVLTRVEQQTPGLQGALVDYLRQSSEAHSGRVIGALLAVDRLSSAYTYWTRLFPPGKQDQSMFVLSLLHDLSAKVEEAIRLLGKK
jgi:hypothetical protein